MTSQKKIRPSCEESVVTDAVEKAANNEQAKGLKSLGSNTSYRYTEPNVAILEAFPNKYPNRDYCVEFDYPEFTSLCPKTGQPDFGTITLRYVPDERCVESKSFKLYMTAYRNQGAFMESVVNAMADDFIALLEPRRLTIEGLFNVRGGTGITVQVEHFCPLLTEAHKQELLRLW